MNVKRIGTVLMVGLLLLSAMVVLVGTVAAASFWEIQFRGTISGEDVGVLVEIERTEGGYTETWSGNIIDGSGCFVTGKKRFNEGNKGTYYITSGYYKMYITRLGGGRELIGEKLIGLTSDAPQYDDPGETQYPNGDGWFTWVPGTYPTECYYIYDWQKQGEIPEFSTIAIPIASILGLLFFFNRRKHRKE
jgi:hypothetical protein